MRTESVLFALLSLTLAAPCLAGNAYREKWEALINARDYKTARAVCGGWLKTEKGRTALAEAHKCMANVEMENASSVGVRSDGRGGGSIGNYYGGPGVDKAVEHLGRAIALAPGDISIHEGRLHILLYSGRVGELPAYLEKSIKAYPGKDGPEYWLNYSEELYGIGQFETGLAYSRVLYKYYPKDHRVVANLGAFLSVLKKDEEALKYTELAVKMNPEDQINVWNLGRLYDETGKTALADEYYRKSFALKSDPEQFAQNQCFYSRFVEKKLKDPARACGIQNKYCGPGQRTACAR